jgi:hypothetical protein
VYDQATDFLKQIDLEATTISDCVFDYVVTLPTLTGNDFLML